MKCKLIKMKMVQIYIESSSFIKKLTVRFDNMLSGHWTVTLPRCVVKCIGRTCKRGHGGCVTTITMTTIDENVNWVTICLTKSTPWRAWHQLELSWFTLREEGHLIKLCMTNRNSQLLTQCTISAEIKFKKLPGLM